MGRRPLAVQRAIRGLYSNYNPLGGVPEGALLRAMNCNIDRPGVLSKRRGFKRVGNELSQRAKSFLDFKNRLVVHDGQKLRYDSTGSGDWVDWDGLYQAPDSSHRLKGVEARSSTYFVTANGVYKNDSLTNNPKLAGIPQALDISLSKVGSGGGFLTPDAQVSYRVVWGRKDDNDFLVLGAPSYQEVATNATTSVTMSASGSTVTVSHPSHGYATLDTISISSEDTAFEPGNKTIALLNSDEYTYTLTVPHTGSGSGTAGKAFDVDLEFTIPDGIVDGDFYQIYRTALSADATTFPGDEHRLVIERTVSSSDLSSKTISFSDDSDSDFLGERLYTNPSEDGISQENRRPPFAKDLALFKGYMFYANTRREHEIKVQLRSLNGISNGDTISIHRPGSSVTYTFSSAEDIENRKFLLSTSQPTASQNISETMKSLVRVINRETEDSDLYAWYCSGNDDAPGQVLLRGRSLSSDGFYLLASSSTVGGKFNPEIPTSGDRVSSSDESVPNGLARSKFEQPEAVPNEEPVGSEESPTLRILPLRDSLIILKEEGVWRLSGESETSFVTKELDPTVRLKAPDTAVVLNNAVYCASTQGVVRIDEQGTALVSWPEENELKKVISLGTFAEKSFAVAYESERKYILFTPEDGSDKNSCLGWIYNYVTKEWTQWSKPVSCGAVLFDSDVLHMGHADDKYVLKERKTLTATGSSDYVDEDIPCSITSHTTTTDAEGDTVTMVTVTYDYPARPIQPGFLFTYGNEEATVTAVTTAGLNSFTLTLNEQISMPVLQGAVGAGGLFSGVFFGISGDESSLQASIGLPIDSEVRWAPENAGISEMKKQFPYAAIYF